MVDELIISDFKKKIDSMEDLFVVDVRPKEIFDNWHMKPFKNVILRNIPNQEMVKGVDIPKGRTVYTMCNKGNSSKTGAMTLSGMGYKAISLAGGMKGYSQLFERRLLDDGVVKIYQFERLGKNCLSYVLVSGGFAIIIDPSMYVDQYIRTAKGHGAEILYIMDTHRHADHISGASFMKEKNYGIYHCPSEDFENSDINKDTLNDEQGFIFGQSKIKVIRTPGHTMGMASILVNEKYLFCGDTLFIESVSRPDLSGQADFLAPFQYESLQLIKGLGDVIIFPGHFSGERERRDDGMVYESIKDISERNNFLKMEKDKFISEISSNLPAQPNNYERIRELNLTRTKPSIEELQELEFGPNNCSVKQ